MSWGTNLAKMSYLGGVYPADLPVQQATEVELIINFKTARCSASPCRRRYSAAPTS
jgi:hypothetical protein